MSDQETTGREELPELQAVLGRLDQAKSEVNRHVVGQEEVVEQLFSGLLGAGHVLIEGAPGLGKTLLVRTLGTVCGLFFSRIQFTPDLMPADITGSIVLLHDETGGTVTRFQPGPIFAQMVLADEINRATPKTQSALLEAMQEGTATVAGTQHQLPRPFFVLATQNPIEMEGTYLLPEAQVDRFLMKVDIPFPNQEIVEDILALTTGAESDTPKQMVSPEDILRLQRLTREVPIASHVREAVARLVLASQPQRPEAHEDVKRYVRFGVSPRGAQALVLAAKARALMNGRFNVAFEDLDAVAAPTLRHRIHLNYEAEVHGLRAEEMIQRLFSRVAAKPMP